MFGLVPVRGGIDSRFAAGAEGSEKNDIVLVRDGKVELVGVQKTLFLESQVSLSVNLSLSQA